jgi:hypothetical protein
VGGVLDARASKRAAARRARGRKPMPAFEPSGDTANGLMGMITEDGEVEVPDVNINSIVEGSEAIDMFMDTTNPYGKTVHAALATVAKDMEKRLQDKGDQNLFFLHHHIKIFHICSGRNEKARLTILFIFNCTYLPAVGSFKH